ncbi:glycosyltransferase [uncultured Bacteroides sp.]|uniref:glycosyltransferase family 2 protein n=1 Tax=uncultured Bacteroides sp. TaxID=162156 RepID=UPI00262F9B15|nr:glycosyltransferase [uncultured Bacteroides sp.]
MKPLLSIIIPCYNSARFINDIIDMLYDQGLDECELILVDDGSEDDTLEILNQFIDNEKVFVIHQENQGVSMARNHGLAAATGRYIYFLDSDDSLVDNTLTHFKKVLHEHQSCQMFAFGYEMRENSVLKKQYLFPAFDGKEWNGRVLIQNFLNKRFCIHICSSIYERDFLLKNNLSFRKGLHIGEDVLFLLQALLAADKIFYSLRTCFIYQVRNDSAMQGYKSYSEKQYLSHTVLREYLLPIGAKDKSLSNYINFFLLFSYISNLRYYLRSDCKSRFLNYQFLRDGSIRYKSNYTGNLLYWIAMKIMMIIPLRLILNMFKRS